MKRKNYNKENFTFQNKNIGDNMKDLFKIHQMEMVQIGGLHCPCCNKYRGKNSTKKRQIMNKRVRSVLKQSLKKEIEFALQD